MSVTMRRQAADTVCGLFSHDDRIAVVLSEISVEYFAPAFAHDPGRIVNVGIMEATMVGVAAGFAMEGFHPVAHTISPFLAERALEQVKLDLGNQELGATLIGTGGSFDYGVEGTTHHAPGDVQAMLTIPGMRVLVPGHPAEVDTLLRATLGDGVLTYMRLQAVHNPEPAPAGPGRVRSLRAGGETAVLAIGPMLGRVLEATVDLDVRVLYTATAAPIDRRALREVAAGVTRLITVEPFHEGTLAPQVVPALADRPARFEFIGVPRRLVREYGSPQEHDRALGLDAAGLRARIAGGLA
jgi:transketolase